MTSPVEARQSIVTFEPTRGRITDGNSDWIDGMTEIQRDDV